MAVATESGLVGLVAFGAILAVALTSVAVASMATAHRR